MTKTYYSFESKFSFLIRSSLEQNRFCPVSSFFKSKTWFMFSCSVLVYHPITFSINQLIFMKFYVASDYNRPYQVLATQFQKGVPDIFPGGKKAAGTWRWPLTSM